MSVTEELRSLGRENSVWKLTSSSAKLLAEELGEADRPSVVLPMREVWVGGTRLPGMRPTVCLSEKKLLMVSHPGIFSSGKCQSWNRAGMVSISTYHDRVFEISMSDGQIVKMRGMIGEKRVEAMTERLYGAIKSAIEGSHA